MSADGAAALVAAAVRAAVLAKAPRRTVAAVAAAVASALGRLQTVAAAPQSGVKVPTGAKSAAAAAPAESADVPSPEEMLAALRSARAAQRRRRKQRRRAAKEDGRSVEREGEVVRQPQGPDPGGVLEPSLSTAGAALVPMDVEAVEVSGRLDTNRSADASPPRKLPRLEDRRETDLSGVIDWDIRTSRTFFTDRSDREMVAPASRGVLSDEEDVSGSASRGAGMPMMPHGHPPQRVSAATPAAGPLQKGRGRGRHRHGGAR